ncbi:class IV adenylate cyclase [Nonomuraea sp. NPDC049141]|uniref:class IV adenylate cyclase n=1 Tax=Nonomuraea sp. NPDC049141 TaxID=3155500 RepID=UPI0033E07EBF
MPIEAEIKARVRRPEAVREAMRGRAAAEILVYTDAYYDAPGHPLTTAGSELRIRTVTTPTADRGHDPNPPTTPSSRAYRADTTTTASSRTILTYKAPSVHEATGSKPESETEVADPEALDAILRGLGYEQVISYEKHCVNWSYTTSGRRLLATLVTIPDLDGTFLEIETLTDDLEDLPAALAVVRAEMLDLGVEEHDFTTELYTEAVARSRTG